MLITMCTIVLEIRSKMLRSTVRGKEKREVAYAHFSSDLRQEC